MATYNDIKKIKIGDNTFVFHVPTASEVGALPSSTTIPAITLNGSGSTSPSFYAPTTVGTSGYVLKSNGSGAPTWTSATLTDTKVSTAAVTSGTTYYPIVGADTTSAATKFYDKTGISYTGKSGASSSEGYATLTLGNSTSSTASGGKTGRIEFYGQSQYKTTLESLTVSNNSVFLPLDSGTLALTSQVDTAATKVTQTATTGNESYEILFSSTADNTTRTEGTRKSSGLTFNPSSNELFIGLNTSATSGIDKEITDKLTTLDWLDVVS